MADRDETIQDLRKRLAKLKREVERLEAVKACINVANRYQVHHNKQSVAETHLFALKTPGTRVEMLWGIYDEPEGVLRWKRSEGYGRKSQPLGRTPGNQHAMTTPIIEVAKNGQTARGLWLMFAYYGASWAAGQFAMDFIKEDGEWKIWHYNTGGLIFSLFEEGWTKQNAIPEHMLKGHPKEELPDRPASYPWMWSSEATFQNIPPVPLPYETWDESLACIPAPGEKWDISED
jgi:hypothetical protein